MWIYFDMWLAIESSPVYDDVLFILWYHLQALFEACGFGDDAMGSTTMYTRNMKK